MSVDFVEFVNDLQRWHEHQVQQLRLVVDNKDSGLKIGDMEIEVDSDLAKGFRAGVATSLQLLGELPFTVMEEEEDDGQGQER